MLMVFLIRLDIYLLEVKSLEIDFSNFLLFKEVKKYFFVQQVLFFSTNKRR